jgi:hypothetical protein
VTLERVLFCTCAYNEAVYGGYVGIEYRVRLHDSIEFVFSYINKTEINKIFSIGDWMPEQELQYKFIPHVYSKNNEYIALFPNKRKEYGLYCANRTFFERLKANKLVFFNPDDDFTQIHFMELLDEHEIAYFRQTNNLESFVIEGLSSEYEEYSKAGDGRILAILNGHLGELFMSIDELVILRKMESGTDFIVAIKGEA